LKPAEVSGSETWVVREMVRKSLNIWQRKILRRI